MKTEAELEELTIDMKPQTNTTSVPYEAKYRCMEATKY